MMVVGTCRLHLHLPDNDSLKGKRRVVRQLIARVRARFNVAAAEVACLDQHRHAELGFAVVSNDGRHANSMLDKIAAFCEQHAAAEVAAVVVELIPMGRAIGAPMAELDEGFPDHWRSR